ncbi:alginate lyase family protein [uncultured Lamprocystis sp.]|jgi:uncharacterized heparinase superfamily protein|uniref:heparinase II/III family protein n=1 Tax=uncultured Lamprocystis sp. TaxID=543132 RepID=UPI0025E7AFEE|nr:alginate lyase family protein [uncultured Lamprocystis sp.]
MVSRYWHTLRYLRPVQFYGRLWFRLYRPKSNRRPAPLPRPTTGQWCAPAARSVSMQGPETFRFLNETHQAAGPDAWNDPARDKLWLYNLHYFDDLNAADAATRRDWHLALLQRWVAENPPGIGNGWEPYPTALRIVNWIKWSLAGHGLPSSCHQSLAVQARWLSRRLEYHLLGNHLFANAKALVFAGAFGVGPEADDWLALGSRLLRRELGEQVLPDGGHFERSPMYHAILLEDVLDLINLAGAYPGTADPEALGRYRACAASMTHWLQVLCHPDGEIAFFNDAAFGIAPNLAELVDYGRRLGQAALAPRRQRGNVMRTFRVTSTAAAPPSPVWLLASGYVRLATGPAVALLDVAPIGPDYLPGHAHADTLSFELSLFGQRVIVNGGTSRYGSSPERLAERGTAAHSTVQIDNADSSEVWGGFRVARRARPFDVTLERAQARFCRLPGQLPLEEAVQVLAAHDGYCRLPGRPVHRRTWRMTASRCYVIDTVEGDFRSAITRFHLHPAIEVTIDGEGMQGCLRLSGGQAARWQVSGGEPRIVADHWHSQFGLSLPSRCLEVVLSGNRCRLDLDWSETG